MTRFVPVGTVYAVADPRLVGAFRVRSDVAAAAHLCLTDGHRSFLHPIGTCDEPECVVESVLGS